MQNLKDAAILAVLLLVALSVRVSSVDTPATRARGGSSLATPAFARPGSPIDSADRELPAAAECELRIEAFSLDTAPAPAGRTHHMIVVRQSSESMGPPRPAVRPELPLLQHRCT